MFTYDPIGNYESGLQRSNCDSHLQDEPKANCHHQELLTLLTPSSPIPLAVFTCAEACFPEDEGQQGGIDE